MAYHNERSEKNNLIFYNEILNYTNTTLKFALIYHIYLNYYNNIS